MLPFLLVLRASVCRCARCFRNPLFQNSPGRARRKALACSFGRGRGIRFPRGG